MKSQITTIKTGNFEVIESGIFQVQSKELTTIIFDFITITFEFANDDTNSEPLIKVNTEEENIVKFRLININMPSYGTIDFVKFASLNDKEELFISFRVHSLNDKNVRSLEYSIYKKNV